MKRERNLVRPQVVTGFSVIGPLHAHQRRSFTIVVDTQARPLSGIVRIRIRKLFRASACRTLILTDSERVPRTKYRTAIEISGQLSPASP